MMKKKEKLFFNFIELAKDFLLVNEVGDWLMLEKKDFKLEDLKNPPAGLYQKLKDSGLIIKDSEIGATAERMKNAYNVLDAGTYLHIIIPTKRCNQFCRYCHASAVSPRSRKFDMSLETAEKTLDRIFEAKAQNIQIEFQGGEPFLNWPVVKHVINRTKKKEKASNKKVSIKICSNLTLATTDKIKFLIKNNVFFSTSFDGGEKLQNYNRPFQGGKQSFNVFIEKIKQIRKLQAEYDSNFTLGGAIVTVSQESLKYPKEIVDAYIENGFKSMYIRSLFPLGRGGKEKESYSVEEYFAFYKKILERIYFWEKQGKNIVESYLFFMLKKVFRISDHAWHCDLRSPCGAGIGQLAYNYDGKVYTCDDARSLPEKYLSFFEVGNVFENTASDFINSIPVKACATASCLDNVPVCSDCAYKPFCSVCPVYNIATESDIFPRPGNFRCELHKKMLDYIFLSYRENNKFKINLFKKWLNQ